MPFTRSSFTVLVVWIFILSKMFLKQLSLYSRYRKYPNLVRTQVEIISDSNYLVRILFVR